MLTQIRRAFQPLDVRPRYADAADGLRVLCVLFVAWFHIWQQSWLNPSFHIFGATLNLRNQVATGYLLVDLMLLLSGFLLYLPYADHAECGVGEFYKRRALRILPSYWFCIFVFLFAFAIPNGEYASLDALMKDLFSHLTFTHNFSPDTYQHTKLNVALWTLAVEVQFYLIFPFLARAFRKKPALCYAGMLLASALYRYFIVLPQADTTIWVNRLPNMLEVYANGMLAACVYNRLSAKKQSAWDALLCTALTVASVCLIWRLMNDQGYVSGYPQIRQGQMDRRFLLSAAGAFFLVCGSRSIALLRWLLSNRLIRFLSGVSFNFYIWHQFFAVKLKEWHIPPYVSERPFEIGEQPWQTQYTILSFAGALVLATLVTYLIEKPAAQLGKRLFSRKK